MGCREGGKDCAAGLRSDYDRGFFNSPTVPSFHSIVCCEDFNPQWIRKCGYFFSVRYFFMALKAASW